MTRRRIGFVVLALVAFLALWMVVLTIGSGESDVGVGDPVITSR
jgi:hypothetical protein